MNLLNKVGMSSFAAGVLSAVLRVFRRENFIPIGITIVVILGLLAGTFLPLTQQETPSTIDKTKQDTPQSNNVTCNRDCQVTFHARPIESNNTQNADYGSEGNTNSIDYLLLQQERRMARWNGFIAWFAGLAFIALVWTLMATFRTEKLAWNTLKSTRTSTAAAISTTRVTREMGMVQSQSYLICNSGEFWLREYHQADDNSWNFGITCRPTIKNLGQSPARSITVNFEAWIMKVDVTRSGHSVGWKDYNSSTFAADIGPGDEETALIEFDLFTPSEYRQFEQSRFYIDIRGEMIWRNEFGKRQTQKFNLQSNGFWKSDFYEENDLVRKTYPLYGIARSDWQNIL